MTGLTLLSDSYWLIDFKQRTGWFETVNTVSEIEELGTYDVTSFIADDDTNDSNKCPPIDKNWSDGNRPLCKKAGPIQFNQCAKGNSCHTNATCENKLDGYICKCNDGYVGDGTEQRFSNLGF